jgi:hypothetical protein
MPQRRTNKGQLIDFDQLLAAQGNQPALGNMGVDAHGNRIMRGEIVETNAERARRTNQELNTTTQRVSLRRDRPETPNTDAVAAERKRVSEQMAKTAKMPKPSGQKEIHHDDGSIEVVPTYDMDEKKK